MNNLRFAVRQLLKNPGFSIVAVLTLALGLSANATILGMIHAFFFQPLEVQGADRLAFVLQKTDIVEFPHGYSWRDYQDLRARVESFEDVLALLMTPAHVGLDGRQPNRAWVECVSPNYFSMLGVAPLHGRVFGPSEGQHPGADPVVVLSQRYWEQQFGGDLSLVGRTLRLNGQPFTVVGIMPDTFDGAQWSIAPRAWVPATLLPQLLEGGQQLLENRGSPAFKILARLKPGVSAADAQAEAKVVVGQLVSAYPKEHRPTQVLVVPELQSRPEPSFSQFMPLAATVFMGLVVLVLMIACANVANLMFARALSRRKEMGIRTALGASRGQLIRQLLVESVVLALVAGWVGSVLAYFFGQGLSGLMPRGDIPMRTDSSWSWSVFLGTTCLAILAGGVTGLAPALQATRLDIHTVLKEGSNALSGPVRHPFRSALVVAQIALCVVVLVSGGLFLESLRQASNLELGFRSKNLLMASVDLGLQRYDEERGRQFYRELLDRVESLAGVEGAAWGTAVPFDYGVRIQDVGAEGTTSDGSPGASGLIAAAYSEVSANYLRTVGATLVQGRDFSMADDARSVPVAVVNQTLARRLWGDANAVGKRLRFGMGESFLEVVGVVRDGKYVLLGEATRPYLYLPLAQRYSTPATIYVRTEAEPLAVVPALRKTLGDLDHDLPIYSVRSMEEHLRMSAMALMPLRLAAMLAGAQGLLGLCLAVMGIYGVVSYVVSRRTREIGIRIALGAAKWEVVRLVVREGWRLTLIGLGLGLAVTLVVALALSRLLYGLNPMNLPVFSAVLFLLAAVALLACYLPARRAIRVDPGVALRCE